MENLIGNFSSKGYIFLDQNSGRPYGLLGGTWELSIVVCLIFFTITSNTKINFENFFLLIITVIILYFSKTRGTTLAFFVALGYFYFSNFKNIYLKLLLLFITISFCFLFFFFYDLNFVELKNLFINFFFYFSSPSLENLSNNNYLSLKYRLDHWLPHYKFYLSNIFSVFFGSGYGSEIYMESLILRFLFSFGIIGCFFTLFLCMKMPFHIIIFIFISGITLDSINSMKIFMFIALCLKYLNYENSKK